MNSNLVTRGGEVRELNYFKMMNLIAYLLSAGILDTVSSY